MNLQKSNLKNSKFVLIKFPCWCIEWIPYGHGDSSEYGDWLERTLSRQGRDVGPSRHPTDISDICRWASHRSICSLGGYRSSGRTKWACSSFLSQYPFTKAPNNTTVRTFCFIHYNSYNVYSNLKSMFGSKTFLSYKNIFQENRYTRTTIDWQITRIIVSKVHLRFKQYNTFNNK